MPVLFVEFFATARKFLAMLLDFPGKLQKFLVQIHYKNPSILKLYVQKQSQLATAYTYAAS